MHQVPRAGLAIRSPARDGFGRAIDYLRISLTDRCNLRCIYCMPTQPIAFTPADDLLTATEIQTVVEAAADLGFRKVRLTGGEPTLRADVVDIVARIAAVPGIADVAMTTNGARLPELAAALRRAGLNRVNIHIDSLKAKELPKLMRWGSTDELWAGIEAAEAADLRPIKLNVVVVRGYNDAEVVDMARLSIDRPWTVRFIELMPLGESVEAQVAVDRYVSNEAVAGDIAAALGPLEAVATSDPSDEARNFRLPGAEGMVGFISPVSDPYCETCNRMRLTADGQLHLCLLHDDEIDLRSVLRSGADAGAIRRTLLQAVTDKPSGHDLKGGVHTTGRRMHAVGG